jgi:hypothetical protein
MVTALSDTGVSDFVFPGQKAGRPLSGMAFAMLMRRMDAHAFTAQGFRSALRDWVGDETSFPVKSPSKPLLIVSVTQPNVPTAGPMRLRGGAS